ncbi:alpha/beta-hydrolase family protein [Leisingera aquaemixtae]|uniref:alpha/beta hydrolase n=1 Tax=Leisingera TaxID=191028 RepID=UPI001C93A079|nr:MULTISPECIES: alpha/beta-hydrolase family protein [Leisingera]MBY6069385.1 alpha/beta-hydrolase family protein [Leisingera aquaemixtae]MCB4458412.1 alpha/beta-hydrolase family protein [Leisingera sp. McT4-56]
MVFVFLRSLSVVGVLVGMALFCASLTPSLLPRVPEVQGTLSGVAFIAGYSIGNLLRLLWEFLEFRQVRGIWRTRLCQIALAASVLAVVFTLSRITLWQNSIRLVMEMEPVDSAYPFRVASIALVAVVALMLLARTLFWSAKRVARWSARLMPKRVSIGAGAIIVAVVAGSLFDGLVVRNMLAFLDQAFAEVDRIVDAGVEPPSGFETSVQLIDWEDIGRNGKLFLTSGPDRQQIEAFTNRPAKQPIRVYAGVNTAETLEDRAKAAVTELTRAGGFNRSVLIVATPTGTGWLDPAAIQPVAFLHSGDLAIVSMQYSYLPSWLTLMVDPTRSRQAARALFREVFEHWKALPKNKRPRLYLFGLSLGALGSEASTDLVELLADPINGAVWAGPPFASRTWSSITRNRESGSPQWRPRYRDGALIRFMNQDGFDPQGFSEWGPLRIVYLQHASDPMSFFSAELAMSKPGWLGEYRGRDVSPYFRWFPLVTFLQVAFDIPMATSVSQGYGHNFIPAEYIDAWIAVTQPRNWTAADTENLKRKFEAFQASPL